MDSSHVASDVLILVEAIKAQGVAIDDGASPYSHEIPFGKLFSATVDTLEALMGTLRAAKKQGVVAFKKQMLLHPGDDKEIVSLLKV